MSTILTAEQQMELAIAKAKDSIGSPAYFSKGIYADAFEPNNECRESAVLAVLQGLNIDIAYADKLSDVNISKWFSLSEAKAKEQQTEYNKLAVLDNSQSFTLED